jgi:DNA-binding MarR family transcriptional regulator
VIPEIQELDRYLHDTLGLVLKATPWNGVGHLPPVLRERYKFAKAELLSLPILLMIDRGAEEQAPVAVRKHMEMLKTKQEAELVYVRGQVTTYNRKRLIEQKVPFIVPGNQMYLPMLAIDLREHFRRIRKETPAISPSTQVVILHALLRAPEKEMIPAEMAALLGYSAMTMTRAFDELEAANLAEINVRGRERCLKFVGDRKELWEKAHSLLRSPVNKRLFIRHVEGVDGFVRAGLTALEHYTMLAAPAYPTYALSREEWKALQKRHKIVEVPAQDPDALEIEVWWYPPNLFAVDGFVDRLSLLLSLKADHDERTEAALEEMMEKFEW